MKICKKFFKYKSLFFLSILVIIALVAGTFAYFLKNVGVSHELGNDFIEIVYYSDSKNDNWDNSKLIGFRSTGGSDEPILLRFKYNEMWNFTSLQDCDISSPSAIYNYTNSSSYNTTLDDVHGKAISPSNPLFSFVSSMNYQEYYGYSNKINGQDVVIKNWSSNFEDDFVLNDDGWYYYKKTLDPGEFVIVLNSLSLNNELLEGTEYYDIYNFYAKYDLLFDFEGLRLEHDNVQNSWGVDFTNSNKDVTWSFEG